MQSLRSPSGDINAFPIFSFAGENLYGFSSTESSSQNDKGSDEPALYLGHYQTLTTN